MSIEIGRIILNNPAAVSIVLIGIYSRNNIITGWYRVSGNEYSRAIVIVPKVNAFERLLANDIGARFV